MSEKLRYRSVWPWLAVCVFVLRSCSPMPHQVFEISKSCLHQLWRWTYSSTHKGMHTDKHIPWVYLTVELAHSEHILICWLNVLACSVTVWSATGYFCIVTLIRQTNKEKIPHCLSIWQDGGLFTFGDGSWGQLGHGSTNNELLPRRVLELMGTEVSQIACGRYCLSHLRVKHYTAKYNKLHPETFLL